MDKRQPLENMGSQAWRDSPGLLGLCFPVNMWKNSMSVFQMPGLIHNYFQWYRTHYAINSSERSLPGYNGLSFPHSHLKITPSLEMPVFSLMVSEGVCSLFFFFFPEGICHKQSHIKSTNQVLRNKKIPELMLFEQM